MNRIACSTMLCSAHACDATVARFLRYEHSAAPYRIEANTKSGRALTPSSRTRSTRIRSPTAKPFDASVSVPKAAQDSPRSPETIAVTVPLTTRAMGASDWRLDLRASSVGGSNAVGPAGAPTGARRGGYETECIGNAAGGHGLCSLAQLGLWRRAALHERSVHVFLGPRRVGFERELSCDLGCALVKGARASAELASRAPQWLTTRTARRTRMTHSKPKVLCKRSSPRQKARCTSHRQGWSLHFSESRFWPYLCRCNSLPEVVARTAAPGPRPCSIPEQNARSDWREHGRHIRECEGTPLPCQW